MNYFATLTARIIANVSLLDDERKDALKTYFLSALQNDGSFLGRGQSDDLYYTSFALRGLFLLGGIDNAVLDRTCQYLCTNRRRQLNPAELTSLTISEFIVHLLQNTFFSDEDIDRCVARWNIFRKDDGCFGTSENTSYSSTYTTFLAAASFEILGRSDLCTALPIEPITERKRPDGGFAELPPLKHSGTNPTAAAVAYFVIKNSPHGFDAESTAAFLRQRQLSCGGFQAHARIPVADLLSTFSAITALQDISGMAELITPLTDFVRSLRCPSGGYYGFVGDIKSDCEYTFYGMALEENV